jgi:hypothetical protein
LGQSYRKLGLSRESEHYLKQGIVLAEKAKAVEVLHRMRHTLKLLSMERRQDEDIRLDIVSSTVNYSSIFMSR